MIPVKPNHSATNKDDEHSGAKSSRRQGPSAHAKVVARPASVVVKEPEPRQQGYRHPHPHPYPHHPPSAESSSRPTTKPPSRSRNHPHPSSPQAPHRTRTPNPPETSAGRPSSLRLMAEHKERLHFFVSAPRGFESLLVAELAQIAAQNNEPIDAITAHEGGVSCVSTLPCAWAINLTSRIANRVLWKIGEGFYRDDIDIYHLAHAIPWSQFFRVDKTLRVDTVAVFSPLKSIAIATLRAKDGVCDHFREVTGARPSVDKAEPQVRLRLYLEKRQASFYLDLSGEPLFKRGYRPLALNQIAPLRENLAVGLLMLAGLDNAPIIFDPFCGSGTFLIEAARFILRVPSGGARGFAFEHLLSHRPKVWQVMRERALSQVLTPENYTAQTGQPLPQLIGADIDGRSINGTRALIASWGWQEWIKLSTHDFLASTPPTIPPPFSPATPDQAAPLLIANPPYGERMGDADTLTALYPQWGRHLKHAYAGWHSAWVSADKGLLSGLGLRPKKKIPLYNGDLAVDFFIVHLFAGKRREFLEQAQ